MRPFLLLCILYAVSACANEETYLVPPSLDQALSIPNLSPEQDMMTNMNTQTDFTVSSDLDLGEQPVSVSDFDLTDMMVDSEVSSPTDPIYAQAMLTLVNEFRQQGGVCGSEQLPSVPPLSLHPRLNQSSLAHAEDMANRNYFSHDSPEGVTARARINQAGYSGSGWGENIAAGRPTAEETFQQWKDSPGHCRNMLSPTFIHLGVGYANNPNAQFRHYWVQNFGRP